MNDQLLDSDAKAAGPDREAGIDAFCYVTAEKAWLYRAVMRIFAEAKDRFVLHLRCTEVLKALHDRDLAPGLDVVELERALMQLCDWSNLQRHYDTAEVTTLEEFSRPRFLYQITQRGEAAEQAVGHFERTIRQPGELQAAALDDIRDLLGELERLAQDERTDSGKVWRTLTEMVSRFEQLTARAQTFIASIQPAVYLQASKLDEFVSYKRMLIDYLERFIQDLVVRTAEIIRSIELVEASGIERLLDMATDRELVDALDVSAEDRAAVQSTWHQRWRGFCGWFIGEAGRRSQAEELRAHARMAIPALLRAVSTIHDRRLQRSDRVADLKTLARWFAECPDDGAAARLWRAAFALSPARHLRVTEATLDEWDQQAVRASASWLDAPPMRIAARLRRTGRHAKRGRPSSVIDRSAALARLATLAADQAREIESARRAVMTPGPMRLSDFERLDIGAFTLFLELLGEALARKTHAHEPVSATSIDGATRIDLEPLSDAQRVTLQTSWGTFRGMDHRIHIYGAESDAAEVPAAQVSSEPVREASSSTHVEATP